MNPVDQSSKTYQEWATFSCLVVLLLIVAAQLQRELQRFQNERQVSAMPEDFPVYYLAGVIARQAGGEQLYYPPPQGVALHRGRFLFELVDPASNWTAMAEKVGFGNTMRFATPPLSALAMAPLTLLPPRTALLVWRGLSLVLLLLSVFLTAALWKPELRLPAFVIGSAAALSFFPAIETLQQGQLGIVLLFLWTAGIYLLQHNRPISSGCCFAVATLLKVTPAAVVPLFIIRRQWKWVFGYAASSCVMLALTIARLGWQNHWIYVTQLLPSMAASAAFFANRSLASITLNLSAGKVPLRLAEIPEMVPSGLLWLNTIVSAAVYFGVLFVFWRKNKMAGNIVYELITLNFVILLVSPAAWRHHYVVALISLLFLWLKWPESAKRWARLELLSLVAATLVLGTVFPEYLLSHLRHSLQVFAVALWPGALLLLTVVAVVRYPSRTVPTEYRHTGAAVGRAVC